MMQKIKKGFSLIELVITVGILGLIALIAVPQYQRSQRSSNLQSTISETESIVKQARNYALTGLGTAADILPTGGYGVFLSTESGALGAYSYDNAQAISFVDDDPAQNDFVDDGEFNASIDVLPFHQAISTYRLCDGIVMLEDAVVIYQPPRADIVMQGTRAADSVRITISNLLIVLTVNDSADPADQLMLEIAGTTGRIQSDPPAVSC